MSNKKDDYAVKYPFIPPVFIMRIFESFRHLLMRIAWYITPSNVLMLELSQSFYLSSALSVAVKLNIPDHLKTGKKTIDELAVLTGSNKENLFRLMRFLHGHRIFGLSNGRFFTLNRYSAALTEGKGSVKYMLLHQLNKNNLTIFSQLEECVLTGKPIAEKILGDNIFNQLKNNPSMNEVYNKAMANMSYMFSLTIHKVYNFKKIDTLVDIGGGNGELLNNLLERHQNLHGILFDLPHVIPSDNTLKNLKGRLKIVAGDLFKDDVPKGDAYMMKSIIHFMNDMDAINVLIKLQSLLSSKDSRILIIEPIIVNNASPAFGKTFDLQLMTVTEGGKERTFEEYNQIISAADLEIHSVTATVSPFSIIDVRKKTSGRM